MDHGPPQYTGAEKTSHRKDSLITLRSLPAATARMSTNRAPPVGFPLTFERLELVTL